MNRWFRNTDGSVSVYLIIIIVPIFLFHALLIDYIRIKQASRETELAARAAVRSTLSFFDRELRNYGLFGVRDDQEQVDVTWKQIAAKNLAIVGNNRFAYTDTRLEEDKSTIQGLFTLANHQVFKKQILEDMKYKAPILFSLELVEKLKGSGIVSKLDATEQFSHNASSLEEKAHVLDVALDDVWKAAQVVIAIGNELERDYNDKINKLYILAGKTGFQTIESIATELQEVEAAIANLEKSLNTQRNYLGNIRQSIVALAGHAIENAINIKNLIDAAQSLEQEIKTLENGLSELSNNRFQLTEMLDACMEYAALLAVIRTKAIVDAERFTNHYKLWQETLDIAKQANESLRIEKEQLIGNDNPEPELNEQEWIAMVHVYDDGYFSDYMTGIGKPVASFSAFQAQWGEILILSADKFDLVSKQLQGMKQLLDDFANKREQLERVRQEASKSLSSRKQEQRTKLANVLEQARTAVGICGDDSTYYRILEGTKNPESIGLAEHYRQYNRTNSMGGSTNPQLTLDDRVDHTVQKAMGFSQKLASAVDKLRDEGFVNEYVLSTFNYRTLKEEDNTVKGLSLSQPNNHLLGKQEIEYVLYGLDSCLANYTAAYGEMFLLFLAIRTTEALLEPGNKAAFLGSPLLVFLTAAAEGASRAWQDMNKLTAGEAVPLISKLPLLTLDYRELLRLFLFIHSNESWKMSRIQALIQLNTGKQLENFQSYMQVTVVTSTQLWFVPGLMKGMNWAGVSSCFSNGNRCDIRKTAVMAY